MTFKLVTSSKILIPAEKKQRNSKTFEEARSLSIMRKRKFIN